MQECDTAYQKHTLKSVHCLFINDNYMYNYRMKENQYNKLKFTFQYKINLRYQLNKKKVENLYGFVL